MPPIDATYTAPSEILARQYGTGPKELGGNPMSVIVAAGPYTVDSNLDYEPLQALLGLVQEERPDVLILVRLVPRCPIQAALIGPPVEPAKQCQAYAPSPTLPQTGPFVDAEHPLIKSGDVDEFPTQLFRSRITTKLAHLLANSPRTAVILVPNGRDLTSQHAAFPQAPLVKEPELGLPKVRVNLPLDLGTPERLVER